MKKLAIVGAGVSGLYAAYKLADKYEITLFEKAPSAGGHAYTIDVDGLKLDIAFLVFNSHAYPEFLKWLKELDLESEITPMVMSFGIENNHFSYSLNNGTRGLNLFSNIWKPEFLKLLQEIKKYREDLKDSAASDFTTISEHYRSRGHSDFFITNFIYPMAISIWSIPGKSIDKMLARTFTQFMGHHRFLKETQGAKWLTFKNSSESYKRKVLAKVPVVLNTVVTSVKEESDRVLVNGQSFDACIIATPADVASGIISDDRAQILKEIRYQTVKASVHQNPDFMPARKNVWSAWNILDRGDQRFITYYLNRVSPLQTKQDHFVTLADFFVDGAIHQTEFRHLILDKQTFEAQEKLPSLNRGRITFAGSYFGKGFHEDAIASSIKAMASL